MKFTSKPSQTFLLDQLRTNSCQLSLGRIRETLEAFLGYSQLQYGIAQELKTLIVVVGLLFVGVGTVRERCREKLDLVKPMVDTILKVTCIH